MTIHASASATKHVQIKAQLLQEIAEGVWTDRLPSETDLAARFGVSRPTVRAALNALARDGIVFRKRGVGTIVSAPRVQFGVSGLTVVFDDQFADFPPVKHRVERFAFVRPPDRVRTQLGLHDARPIRFVKRIGMVNDEPTTVECAFFGPGVVSGDVSKADFEAFPVFADILRVRTHVIPMHTHLWLSVTTAAADVAAHLQRDMPAPVILLKRRTSDALKRPVLYLESFLVPDRFAFHMEFEA